MKQSKSKENEPSLKQAGFRLPSELLDRMDDIWLSRRKTDKKIKKLQVAREVFEKGLKELEAEINPIINS